MKTFFRLMAILAFIGVVVSVIAYARGYRIDLSKKSLKPTGIISISSNPKAAKIYINNELKGVTDSNITLHPGEYQIDIKKDGYTNWSKKINLKGELVMTVDALLFPSNPSLSPLTNLGIEKAIPLDQTDRIILFVENKTATQSADEEAKDGIYLFEANRKPLNILSPLKILLLKNLLPSDLGLIPTAVIFSPDYKQGIFEFTSTQTEKVSAYLISLEDINNTLFDITASKQKLIDAWSKKKEENQRKILETYPKEIIKVASESFNMISFSPNETKVLYKAMKSALVPLGITPPIIASNQTKEERNLKKDHYYIYDKKEDKNYEIDLINLINLIPNKIPGSNLGQLDQLEIRNSIQWYFDSRHLLLNEPKRIIIMDYDGNNHQTVYSAAFENTFITTTSDGNLIVLANLNPEANKYPDLYTVGIK